MLFKMLHYNRNFTAKTKKVSLSVTYQTSTTSRNGNTSFSDLVCGGKTDQ